VAADGGGEGGEGGEFCGVGRAVEFVVYKNIYNVHSSFILHCRCMVSLALHMKIT